MDRSAFPNCPVGLFGESLERGSKRELNRSERFGSKRNAYS